MTQLEEISCPLCGSRGNKLLYETKDFRFGASSEIFNVVQCDNCNFIFLNPRPSMEAISIFYPPEFNKQDSSLLYKIIEPVSEIVRRSTINFIKRHKKEGALLDIGCGNGEFMLAMHNAGYDVWGIEPSQDSEKYSNEKIKGRIFYNILEKANFESKKFDVITMFQSLEHIHNIDSLFKEIKRILKDDGVIYISIPNSIFFESIFFGRYCYNLEVPRHLYFFTNDSISKMLNKYGIEPNKFLKESLLELICTPASLYHSLWYFFDDKNIKFGRFFGKLIRIITFPILVLLRLPLRILFLYENQNLKILAKKQVTNN